MKHLRQHVASGRRYLVIELVTGLATLTDGSDVFRRPGGPGSMQFAAVDLGNILEQFDREAPAREVFTLKEVAAMALEKSPTVHSWVRTGILTPSMRDRDGTRGRAMLFSRLDAFVACLIASLRRKCGLPLAKLHAVSAVLRDPDKPRNTQRPHESTEQKSKQEAVS